MLIFIPILLVNYVASITVRDVVSAELVRAQDVSVRSDDWIHLGVVLADVSPKDYSEQHYVHRL